ncbi:hypothetical protein [Nonomuraea insulae]|uniref:HNH/ENDO VII superfamily nuclease n=1 Tax=Nonomuraea insulae TaxID=1616787 RepID=A0ABW1CQG4_9ACTN
MGVTLPGWAATMLTTVGMPWINVDPDQVDQRAGELSTTVQQLNTVAGQTDDQVRGAVQHTGGDSGEALADFWDSTGAKAVVAGLALTAAAPIVMRGFAHVVRGSQVATLSQLANGMVRANAATVAGGPLARATALASTRLGVARIRQSLARGVEHTLTPAMRRHVTEPLNDVASRVGRLSNPEPQFAGGLQMNIGRRSRADGWMSMKDARRHAEGGYVARTGVPKYKDIHQNTKELTSKDKSEIVKKAKKKGFGWKSYSDVDLGGAKYRVHKDGRIDDL